MAHHILAKVSTSLRGISLRTWKILLSAFCASILVFFLATIRLFNGLLIDDWVQARWIRHMRNFVAKDQFDRRLKIVLIREQQSPGSAPSGDISKDHRQFFAKLTKAMKDGGARVLAFDIAFDGTSTFDKDFFADAISEAEMNGVKVIVGIENFSNGTPEPQMPADLKEPRWGNLSVGGYQGELIEGEPDGKCKDKPKAGPIGTLKLADDSSTNSSIKSGLLVPSLALRIVMETEKATLVPEFDSNKRKLILYRPGSAREIVKSIPLEPENNLIIDQVSPNDLIAARVDPQSFYGDLESAQALGKVFKDSIVLVGYEACDSQDVLSGGQRLGVELHATGVFNILHDIFIYKLTPGYNFLIILSMSLVAALLYTPMGQRLDFKIPWRVWWTEWIIQIPLALIILAIIYLVVAFLVYKQSRTYLDICYHLLALGISYGLTWIVLKLWFSEKTKKWEQL